MTDGISSLNFIVNSAKSNSTNQTQEKSKDSFKKDLFFTKMSNLDLSKETSEQIWSRLNELA